MAEFTTTWGSAPAATITVPSEAVQANGFICGPADPGLFNWMFRELTENMQDFESRISDIEDVGISGGASTFSKGTIV